MSSVYDVPPARKRVKMVKRDSEGKRVSAREGVGSGNGSVDGGGEERVRKAKGSKVVQKDKTMNKVSLSAEYIYSESPLISVVSQRKNPDEGVSFQQFSPVFIDSISPARVALMQNRPQLSPDEARINELKRFVVACGVRKQWCVESPTDDLLAKRPSQGKRIRRPPYSQLLPFQPTRNVTRRPCLSEAELRIPG